jgi:hypothetical protein
MRATLLLGGVLFVGSLAFGACGPPPGFCPGNKCACDNQPSCNFDCAGPGCDADCHNVDVCDIGCGDACEWDCHDADRCDASCGDGCRAECHNASTCEVVCGEDCVVDCHDLSSCRVTMVSGEVHCHNNSDCDIQCALPGGGTVPADECKKDRWRCGC